MDLLINIKPKGFTNLTKDANRASLAFHGLGKAMNGLKQVIGVGIGYQFSSSIMKGIISTMDAIETVNLFSVSLGNMAEETDKVVRSMADLTGLDYTNLQQSVGTYALLARSMGMTNKNASILATTTTRLALDLSSLNNVPVSQVMQDLRSGLLGQSETVYKYGIDVTEAGIKSEAMAQGIEKSVRNMSQGEKMALRYAVMLKQTSLAQGDLARTIDQPANQLRMLQERFITLGRSIGSIFIPLMTAILPVANAVTMILIEMANALAKVFGYVGVQVKDTVNGFSGVEDGADDTTDAVNKTAKAMKNLTSGMDEFNLLTQETGSGGGDSGIGGSISDADLPTYVDLLGTIKQKSDEVATSIRKLFKEFSDLSKGFSEANWDVLLGHLAKLGRHLEPLGVEIFQGLRWFYTEVLIPLGVWVVNDLIPAFLRALTSALDALLIIWERLKPTIGAFFEEFLKPLAEWTGGLIVGIFEALNEQLDKFTLWAKNNPEDSQRLIGEFADIALKVLVLTTAFKGLNAVFTGAQGLIALLKGAVSTTGLLGVALLALGVLMWKSYENWDELSSTWLATFAVLKVGFMNTFVIPMANLFISLQNSFMNNFIIPTANAFIGFQNMFIGVVNFLGNIFETFINGLLKGVDVVILAVSKIVSALNQTGLVNIQFNSALTKKMDYENIPVLRKATYTNADFLKPQSMISDSVNNDWQNGVSVPSNKDGLAESSIMKMMQDLIKSSNDKTVIENIINLDGDVIYKNQQKVASERGQNFDLGVFVR